MFIDFLLKKTAPILFLFFASWYYCQTYTISELNKISNELVYKGKVNDALKINFKSLDEFKNKNDAKSMATAYINIAGLLWNINRYKDALHYLDNAKEIITTNKNTKLEAKLYNEYGRNYNSLDLYKHSNIQLNKAFGALKDIPKEHQNIYSYYIYFKKWENFVALQQKDSAYIMKNNALRVFPTSELYLRIAEQFMHERKHLDSADYYINKAILEKDQSIVYNKALMFKIRGDLYKVKGEKNEALKDYLNYLELSKKINKKTNIREAYDRLSGVYKELGNNEKYLDYIEDYKQLNDSIKKTEKLTVRFIVNKINDEKEAENQSRNKKTFLLIFIICSIIIISVAVIFFIQKNYIKGQNKKDKLIQQKTVEVNVLEKKVNKSFGEVIKLAKNNDPFFISRFKEVYPEFYDKLIQINPKLTPNNIKLAAYIRLNLSNKEIATFENLTVRTIEIQRYRLKKRLGLGTDTDLTEWINKL